MAMIFFDSDKDEQTFIQDIQEDEQTFIQDLKKRGITEEDAITIYNAVNELKL